MKKETTTPTTISSAANGFAGPGKAEIKECQSIAEMFADQL
jgi:hypothetical protein